MSPPRVWPIVTAPEAFAVPEGMLYLDGAAHAPPLKSVRAAAVAALHDDATPWFGTVFREHVERVRSLAARVFDDVPDAVALVPSAAYGLALAAGNLPLQRDQAVLVLDGQFPSNLLPWQQRCAQTGARLIFAQRDAKHDWTAAVLRELDRDPQIAILALPQVHWRDGTVLDLTAIASRAHEREARLVLDLSQSLGAAVPDLAAWKPEFVVAVGYKWLLGPYGLAYLWAAPRWRAAGVPLEHGWMARDHPPLWQPEDHRPVEPLPGARRFDADGVCDLPRLAMAEAALSQVHAWGVDALAAILRERIDGFASALREQGLGSWLPRDEVAHFLALSPPPGRAEPLAAALRAEHVVLTANSERLRIATHLHVDAAHLQALAARIGALAGAGLRDHPLA